MYGCKLYYVNVQMSPTIDSFNACQPSFPVLFLIPVPALPPCRH